MTLLGGNLPTVELSHLFISILNQLASLYLISHLTLNFRRVFLLLLKVKNSLPFSSQILLSVIERTEIIITFRTQTQKYVMPILWYLSL